MDRYQQMIKKDIKPTAYRFRASNNVSRVCDYLKKCIQDKVAFDSSNINTAILDPALIKLSKDSGYPIIVGSETREKAIKMTYGVKRVYSLKTIPNIAHVICYYDLEKKQIPGLTVVLKIIRNEL